MSNPNQINYWRDERHLAYHRRQFAEPYHSTRFLGNMLKQLLPSPISSGNILDVACGSGAGMAYLSRVFPRALQVWISQMRFSQSDLN